MLIVIFLPLIIALICVMKKKTGLYVSVLSCCVSLLCGVLIYMGIIFASTGMDILTFYSVQADAILAQNEQAARSLYFMTTMDTQAMTAEFEGIKNSLVQTYVYSIPAYLTAFCLFGGLCFYLIVRGIAKATGAKVARIPAFSDYNLPKHFGRWTFLGYVIALVGNMNGWHNFDIVYVIIATILGCVYYVQGMCLVDFWLKRKIKYPAVRVIIYIVVTMLIWQAFAFIGAFEQMIKIRKRVNKGTKA